jgi:hypothetical protein
MNKHHVILFLAGVALGYFAYNTLVTLPGYSSFASAINPATTVAT